MHLNLLQQNMPYCLSSKNLSFIEESKIEAPELKLDNLFTVGLLQ